MAAHNPIPPNFKWKDIQRFWMNVQRNGPSVCWPWIGDRARNGYGRFFMYERGVQRILGTHKIALFLTTGKWSPVTMHRCDNRPCCNPEHLHAAQCTAENAADAAAKGRLPKGEYHWAKRHPEWIQKGEDHPNARLTWPQVDEIRTLYTNGKRQRQLAEMFGVCQGLISDIVRGKRWALRDHPSS